MAKKRLCRTTVFYIKEILYLILTAFSPIHLMAKKKALSDYCFLHKRNTLSDFNTLFTCTSNGEKRLLGVPYYNLRFSHIFFCLEYNDYIVETVKTRAVLEMYVMPRIFVL